MTDRHPSAIDERTYQRRRLGVLAGALALVLAAGAFVGGPAGDGGDQRLATEVPTVRAASLGSPTAVRELLSETTTTLVAATGARTTAAPSTTTTTTTVAPSTTTAPAEEPAPTSATTAPSTTTPSTTSSTSTAPPATAAPTTAPPTTAAPTTTTTTAPAATTGSGGEEYAYDDPRSTQVWYDLAGCESGGDWSIDTGNGYYGGLQFSLATWESVGGTGYPHEHPAATQIEMGRRLQARQGWGAWPHCSEELGLR